MPVLADQQPTMEGASATGLRLCLGDEDNIRTEAEDRAHAWLEAYAASPGWRDAEADTPWIQSELECPRYQRRTIRREVRQAQAWLDCGLKMAGPGSPSVSGFTLASCRQTWSRGRRWSAAMSVAFADGTSVPLAIVQDHARSGRRAQLYTVSKAMESEGLRREFQAFFVTLTLPGEYHSFCSGARAPNGTYPDVHPNPDWNPKYGPVAQWTELQGRWKSIRSRMADHHPLREWWGISVPEPHQDGTPHLHIMVWLPRTFEERGRTRQTAHVLRDILRDVSPDREGRMEIVRKRSEQWEKRTGKKSASPASYVMKYVMMSLDDAATQAERGEGAERHRAWASTRGLRRMRLVGVHGSLRIWQRLWTADEVEYDAMPTTAQDAWDAMRRSEEIGDGAEAEEAAACAGWPGPVPPLPGRPKMRDAMAAQADEHDGARAAEVARVLRLAQARAAADALREIGGLPGGNHRLRLGYEESLTEHGRPSRKPVTIGEEARETVEEEYVTPVRGLVRRQTVTRWAPTGATMQLRRQEAQLVPTETIENVDNRNRLTVTAIYPRGAAGATPPATHEADPNDLAYADDLERLIETRIGQQSWREWCDRMRERVHRLRTGPPDDKSFDVSGKIEAD